MKSLSLRTLIWILVAIVGLVCTTTLVGIFSDHLVSLRYYVERVELANNPSATRAYQFAMRHFDSKNHAAYNTNQATYFLKQTLLLDPQYPYANHQLARIHFLQGNFGTALITINREIALRRDDNPNAYYVRGLIEGYAGSYEAAASDFAHFISLKPDVWAGYNDYSWVLMKVGDYQRAKGVLIVGLAKYPDNAWLLNSFAIALHESGDNADAKVIAQRAEQAVNKLAPEDWSAADPGNDPRIAEEGLKTFREATLNNLDKILNAEAASTVQF